LASGGQTREFWVKVPANYDRARPLPLVVGLHWRGGQATDVYGDGGGAFFGLKQLYGESAVFVAPNGLDHGWANTGDRDIHFIRAMVDRLKQGLCIDNARVHATGFSFGGMMSFTVGCAMGGVFRAIAPMAGNSQVSGCEDGDEPVAVLGFHGVDDTVVTVDGGRRGRDVFVERNGCDAQTMPVEPSWCGEIGQNYQPCSCVSYTGCTAGYPVVWCEFKGPHTPAPSSAETIWSFFSQF
jgi:poly(3-hydroxybutyrate) depolymerase